MSPTTEPSSVARSRIEPDLLLLQETSGVRARQLGRKLGWHFVQTDGSVGIVSRHPIVDRLGTVEKWGTVAVGARVELPAGPVVDVWALHLAYHPYGPYDACFAGMTPDELLDRERAAGRPQQMAAILRAVDRAADDGSTAVIAGDLNAPSHLDWIPAAADDHCGYGRVAWPSTVLAEEAGFLDSFRVVKSDPVDHPGTTWSPIYPRHQGSDGRREPQDRIDVILFRGDGVEAVSSRRFVAGDPRPYGEHKDNQWTSDHAAVITTFAVG